MKKAFFTMTLLALALSSQVHAANRTATLTLNAATKYQYIDGFGGTGMNAQWGDVYTQTQVNKLWGQGADEVGLNIMRLRINPNEGNWGEYSNPVKWARKQNPALQVFATPWTPPKMYKTHNTNKYQNDFGTWVWPLVEHTWGGQGSNGGAIDPQYYDDFADFLERYRQKMADKGAPIDMISIQNECDYTPTTTDNGVEHASYESCIYSPTQMAAMCKALRQKLDPSCKVMGPECFGWGEHTYNNKLVTMKDATDNIEVWGNHNYGTNDWSFVQNITNKTGKHMWMTEFLIDYDAQYTGQFSYEYAMVENLEKTLTSGYSAYVYYSMKDHFFASSHGGSSNELNKRAYVFRHYTHYATGKTRIKSTLSDSYKQLIGGSAYISENEDTVTVFLLNRSSGDNYTVTVKLPFVPQGIKQIATSQNVNWSVSDVTSRYATSENSVRLQLLPGVFYTFQFVKEIPADQPLELATTAKEAANGNPLSANHFMADPTAIEYNGRLYVYGTNDQQEFIDSYGMQSNSYAKINQLVCMSTADLVNWTMHDPIDVKAAAPWIWASWAPSIVSRQQADGLTHFYLYFTNGAAGIGVLTSTSPTGPWTDPLGHALIDGQTAGLGQLSNIIDPGVAINDDGTEAYLTFGGGDVTGTELQPGNARIVRLGQDMISLDSDIKPISAPCHFEANELNYIGSKWYFSYCTRWNIASDWSTYSKGTAPKAASIVFMTSTDPLADDWTFRGEILPNPGQLGYPYGNNHTHIQQFNGIYYLLYHTQWLERQLGYSAGYRNLQLNRVTIVDKTSKIIPLTATTANLTGVQQLSSRYVNPYEQQSGAMSAISTENWWMVRGVDFAQDGNEARSLVLRVRGTGTLEVRTSNIDDAPIATASFSGDDKQTVVVPVTDLQNALCDYLYFVFTHNQGAEVLSWQFSSQTVEELLAGISEVQQPGPNTNPATFNLQGQRVQTPRKGIYIRGNKKINVSL